MTALPLEALAPWPVPSDPYALVALARSFGPLRAVTPEQAPVVRAATDYLPSLRPKWQRRGDGIHVHLTPSAYAEGRRYVRSRQLVVDEHGRKSYRRRADTGAPLVQWRSRQHWVAVVVPAAIEHAPEHLKTATGAISLRNGSVSAATLLAYAGELSKFADERTGRRCIVRPDRLAELMGVSLRTVQRCQEALEALGVYVVMMPGRLLNEEETYKARNHGSPQRGLSNDAALVEPHWLPAQAKSQPGPQRPVLRALPGGHVTPTSGRYRKSSHLRLVTSLGPYEERSAGIAEPPPAAPSTRRKPGELSQSRQHRAPTGPQTTQTGRQAPNTRIYDPKGLELARRLSERLTWLRSTQPGRLEPMLRRFAHARLAWTAADVVAAMDQTNARLGRASMTSDRIKHPPAFLAKQLRDLDVDADHPRFGDDPDKPWVEPLTDRQRKNRQVLEDRRRRGVPATPAQQATALAEIREQMGWATPPPAQI